MGSVRMMFAAALFASLALVCLAVVSAVWLFYEGGHANISLSMNLMDTAFSSYCTGKEGSAHNSMYFNVAGACEWVLVGTLLTVLCLKLHGELGQEIRKQSNEL